MDTLTLDRTTPIDELFTFIGANRVTATREAGKVTLTPEDKADDGWPTDYPNPNDYDNDTDYLCAIPGMAESIIELMNAPLSEFDRVPKEWFNA